MRFVRSQTLMALWAAFTAAVVGAAAAEPAGPPPEALAPRLIATIDFYGLRRLDVETLRKALPIHEGDSVAMIDGDKLGGRLRAALSATPHVRDVRANIVCCSETGGLLLFVGVQEDTAPPLHFHSPPAGAQRLPDDLIAADTALDRALFEAVQSGHTREDDSQGHAVQTEAPAARALQEQRVAVTAGNLPLLRQVLRESADARQRAMAARYLGYALDMQAVVDDLAYAAADSDQGVRNDAVRALLVFSRANRPPRIPYDPFVALLESPLWTDLNKASGALDGLTAHRDPELLALLKRRSLPALASIARWKSRGHARAGYDVLGRIAGYSEAELQADWDRGDTEPVIQAALQSNPSASGPR